MSECPTLPELLSFSVNYLGSEWESPPQYSTLEEAWREVAWSGSRDLFLKSAVVYALAREGDLQSAQRVLGRARVEVGEEMNRLTRLNGNRYLDALEEQIKALSTSTPPAPEESEEARHKAWVCRQVEDALEEVESEWDLTRPPSLDALTLAVERLGAFTAHPQVDLLAAWIVLALAIEGNPEWSEVFFNVIKDFRPREDRVWYARRYLSQVCALAYGEAVSRLNSRPTPHYLSPEEFDAWVKGEMGVEGAEGEEAGVEVTAPHV